MKWSLKKTYYKNESLKNKYFSHCTKVFKSYPNEIYKNLSLPFKNTEYISFDLLITYATFSVCEFITWNNNSYKIEFGCHNIRFLLPNEFY